jgi:hypothetical protein
LLVLWHSGCKAAIADRSLTQLGVTFQQVQKYEKGREPAWRGSVEQDCAFQQVQKYEGAKSRVARILLPKRWKDFRFSINTQLRLLPFCPFDVDFTRVGGRSCGPGAGRRDGERGAQPARVL